MKWTSFFCLVFFLSFFALPSFAVLVSVRPLQRDSFEVHSFEVTELELVVVNDTPFGLSNYDVMLSTSPELVFVLDNFEEKQQRISFVSIAPNETKTKTFFVKSISTAPQTASITAEFDQGGSSGTYSVSLFLVKSPLEFSVRLEKTAIEPLEQDSVGFDLKNTGSSPISDVVVSLEVPQGFDYSGDFFSAKTLSSGQSVLGSKLVFNAGEIALGEQPLVVKASYSDGFGLHEQQKTLLVDVRERSNYLLVLAGIIILIILVLFFFGRRKNEPAVSVAHSTVSEKH